MSDEDFAVLQNTLSPVVNPDSEQVTISFPPSLTPSLPPSLPHSFPPFDLQGWEEQTDASISHLLRTTLAKSSKDQSGRVGVD